MSCHRSFDPCYCFFALQVSTGLLEFCRKQLELDIIALEAGGGGDCFHLAFGAILQQIAVGSPELGAQIQSLLPGVSLQGSLYRVATGVRTVIARELHKMPEMQFLDFVLNQLMWERIADPPWISYSDMVASCS